MTTTAERRSRADPRFIHVNGRRLFALQFLPTGPCRGAVLYLPPFAEEMNRCRSHVAATARALAAAGYRCVLLDPFGTGESEGDFSEADWDIWVEDAKATVRWVQETETRPITLWGLRTGALLAAEVATALPGAVQGLLFWQPVLDGAMFLNQTLRLRIASQVVHDGDRETTDSIRQRLAAGEHVEVAGYPLSGAMADTIASRKMAALAGLGQHPVTWIEVVAKPEQPLAPASRKLIETLQAAGSAVQVEAVACPPIWQAQDRVEAPQLLESTLRLTVGDAS